MSENHDAATTMSGDSTKEEKEKKAAKITAQLMTRPAFLGAHTTVAFVPESMRVYGQPRVFEMWEQFRDEITGVVRDDDMSRPETMLMAQAMSLEAIFNRFAELAAMNIEKLSVAEGLMRMALKAQGQCTQTLRVLGELKNPRAPATFVKQANIANGPQQVNNGPIALGEAAHAHTEKETPIQTNELLADDREAQHAATLDTGATSRAGREDPRLETVGAVHGSHD